MFGSDAVAAAIARAVSKIVSIEIDPKASHKQNRDGANWNRQLDFANLPWVTWGQIVDEIPTYNLYKVQIENDVTCWCSFGTQTGLPVSGVRQLNTLPHGSNVFVVMHPGSVVGTIIAVDPQFTMNSSKVRSDFISQSSRCGLFVDAAFQAPMLFQQGGGTTNFICGRPLDSLSGEEGSITETGLLRFLDPYMLQMRVDEETGLWLFYDDQLTRLAGHNLETRSALCHSEQIDDESEVSGWRFVYPYYHESLGVFYYNAGSNLVAREYSVVDTQQSVPEYSNLEPLYDDQQPFPRVIEFEGYLGQGGHEMICLPPVGASPGVTNRYSVDQNYVGVYRNFRALTGAWYAESAKRIILAKRVIQAVPKQFVRPEDARGDSANIYRAAGIPGYGSPDALPHLIKDGPDLNRYETRQRSVVTAAAILDLGAFALNWESLHPFHYHQLDWYLWEEGLTEGTPQVSMPVPAYGDLACSQYLNAPTPIPIRVDHRYQNVNYYPNESYIAMLEEGGIVIGDGYGAEIKMTGGSVFISCPGDCFVQPGKTVQLWGGQDVCIRAVKSIDLTTTLRDISIKAEHDLLMLAGNDDCGGVLIESRATQPGFDVEQTGEDISLSGITFKAEKSYVMSTSQKVYIRTVLQAPSTIRGDGDIVLWAAHDLRLAGSYVHSQADNGFFFYANGTTLAEFWPGYAGIYEPLYVDKGLFVNGCGTFKEWVMSTEGHIATALAGDYGYGVDSLLDPELTDAKDSIQSGASREVAVSTLNAQTFDTTEIEYMDGVLDNVFFSLRNEEQYRTDFGFVIFENRWQQLARLNSLLAEEDVDIWEERPVLDYADNPTYPYPGYKWYRPGSPSFATMDLNLYTSELGGICEPRGQAYEEAVYAPSGGGSLNDSYYVISFG